MKYILLSLFFLLTGYDQQTETMELEITVTNINTLKGSIKIGIFNNPITFLETGTEYKKYSKNVTNDTIIFNLTGLKQDFYAISIYHDINSDNECNLNFLGVPIEPYGFSKNHRPKLFKASFDDCKINAHQNMSVMIELAKY